MRLQGSVGRCVARCGSARSSLFLAVWVGTALHFATNLAREHYPAFALAEHGTLRCDDWVVTKDDPTAPGGTRVEPLHPDLFRHTDGHWYANNQVGASLVAGPVLWLFTPLLDRLETIGKEQAARAPASSESESPLSSTYDSQYPRRQAFMAEVRRRGLHLRLGAAAAITATLVMAPAAALLALLMYELLRRRGVVPRRAWTLALLFPLLTPLLFRSALLNHNQLEALVGFAAFALLWPTADSAPTRRRLVVSGLLAGATLLFDYSGAVVAAALGAWVFATGWRAGGARAPWRQALQQALQRAVPFGVGGLLGVTPLWLTQWWQFGDPFRPAQHWMPDAHFSVHGYHGFDLPSAELLWRNLLDPSFGMLAFAPLLLLGMVVGWRRAQFGVGVPAAAAATASSVVPPPVVTRGERLFVLRFSLTLLLFCAANQFTRLQWNTGFRGLAPLVPFLYLAACDGLARVSGRTLALLAAPLALHSWVLAMARATPPMEPASFTESTVARSWQAFFEHGIELPWLTVWRQTQPDGGPAWAGFLAPALVAAIVLLGVVLWRVGLRAPPPAASPADPAANRGAAR